jgi:hypothetical protein
MHVKYLSLCPSPKAGKLCLVGLETAMQSNAQQLSEHAKNQSMQLLINTLSPLLTVAELQTMKPGPARCQTTNLAHHLAITAHKV